MSHLKTRYINETGEYPVVERACYYKTEYVQWLEKLVEEKFASTKSKSMPCPSCGRTLQPLWFCPNIDCENHNCN